MLPDRFCVLLFLSLWNCLICPTKCNDNVAPVLVCPVNIDTTTTTTHATVTWMDPDVTDNVDSGLMSTCSPSSGSSFAVGSTRVTCTASDVAGNTGSCFFDVNVIDNGMPVVTCSEDMYIGRRRQYQATVVWSYPEVSDNVDMGLTATCKLHNSDEVLPSPALLASGIHSVTCTATDSSGNTGYCVFVINVVYDEVMPVVTCPRDVHKVISSEASQVQVTWIDPVVIDNFDSVPLSSYCTRSSGSYFTFGTVIVTCHSTDSAGNIGSCAFNVTVSEGTIEFSPTRTSTIVSKDTASSTNSTFLDWYIIGPFAVMSIIFLVMSVAFIKLYRSYISIKKKATENVTMMNDLYGNLQNFQQRCETPIDTFQNGTLATSNLQQIPHINGTASSVSSSRANAYSYVNDY